MSADDPGQETEVHRVLCPVHGVVTLEPAEYARQVNVHDARWTCPHRELFGDILLSCGQFAEYIHPTPDFSNPGPWTLVDTGPPRPQRIADLDNRALVMQVVGALGALDVDSYAWHLRAELRWRCSRGDFDKPGQ